MSNGDKELYRFGPFQLDVTEHRLESTDGAPIGSIPEKAFQTLIHLVRKSGSLISKDELFAAVWPDAVVEENNLDKAIHTLRHALGEKTGEQKYIETVRKHAYRFVAPGLTGRCCRSRERRGLECNKLQRRPDLQLRRRTGRHTDTRRTRAARQRGDADHG